MSALHDAVTLAIARADGQEWESLDEAPSRAAFMGYPKMAEAAMRTVAQQFTAFALAEFDDNGPHDARGAALWDVSAHLDEEAQP